MKVVFGNTVEYKKHESKCIPLKTPEGKPVIFAVRDCFTWGIQKGKFGGYQVPLVLEGQEEFLSFLMEVKGHCVKHLIETGDLDPDGDHNILKCLYEKGKHVTLYAKAADNMLIRNESNKKKKIDIETHKSKRCNVHAAVVINGIFVSENAVSLQVKVGEVLILKDKKPEEKEGEEPWEEMF